MGAAAGRTARGHAVIARTRLPQLQRLRGLRRLMRRKAELAFGKAQLGALQWTLGRAIGLEAGEQIVDGIRLPYLLRRGTAGVPLVMVHGFGGSKETWLMVALFVARRRSLILIDLPGHGAASDIDEPAAAARAQAAAVARLLDALASATPPQPAMATAAIDLVGTSMGGGIALRFVRDFPGRVRRLVLIASMGPVVEKSEVAVAFERGENPLIPSDEVPHEEFVKLVAERPPRVPGPMQRYVTAQRMSQRPRLERIFRGWVEAEPGDGLPQDLDRIAIPTLILHGARDRVIHPATARALVARLPRAELVLLRGVGHLPQLEQPRLVGRLLERFLSLPVR
jgi:pimeloyl-ACP methyl ester carboxylesterase